MAPEPLAGGSGPGRGALAFIFVTVALDVLAMGIIIPVLPKLVETFLGGTPHGRRSCSACSVASGR